MKKIICCQSKRLKAFLLTLLFSCLFGNLWAVDIANTFIFSKSRMKFQVFVNGSSINQTIDLSVDSGTPGTITLNGGGATWLILPASPTLGTLSFGVDATGLAAGTYTTTVTASAAGFTNGTFTAIITVADPAVIGTKNIKVNFGTSGTTPPNTATWIRDYGQSYGAKGGTYQFILPDPAYTHTYGWRNITNTANLSLSDNGGNGRNRSGTITGFSTEDNLRYKSFVHMQSDDITGTFTPGDKEEGIWQMAVTNGLYEVTVTVGDPTADATTEYHTINVEAVTLIDRFVSTGADFSPTRHTSATAIICVTDGTLTVDAFGGVNTKISSIIIKPAVVETVLSPSLISVSVPYGEPVPPELFSITSNYGAPKFNFTKSAGSDWLILPPSGYGNLSLNFDISALSIGVYQSVITASAPDYPPATFVVELVITPSTLTFTPNIINITSQFGQSVATQSSTLSVNTGSPIISLSKSSGSHWVSLPAMSSLGLLNFPIDVTGLPPGDHQAIITASAPGYLNSELIINLHIDALPLAFTPNVLNFSIEQGQTGITPQISDLATAFGNPPISLVKDQVDTWLLLPGSPAIGSLSFGIDASGLAPGNYQAIVKAVSIGYENAELKINLEVKPKVSSLTWLYRINFKGSANFTQPTGYITDEGDPYGDQGAGIFYGWINVNTGLPANNKEVATNGGATSGSSDFDKLHLSYNSLENPIYSIRNWEIAIPNGLYNVLLSVGDPSVVDGIHHVNIEGVNAINNFMQTNDFRTKTALVTVQVNDGKLTLDGFNGGQDTKINYINIGLANPGTDDILPVVYFNFIGTSVAEESPTIFKDQVVVDIIASDAGGSGLASIEYSINGGAFLPYTNGLLVNEIGTYTIVAKARDGNGNESITPLTTFEVVPAVRNNSKLSLQNLDRFPANDHLSFSRIQIPWQNEGPNYAANHDLVILRIRNSGVSNLRIDAFEISNNSLWIIDKLTGANFNPATQLPLTLTPGQFVDITVKFIATYPVGQAPPGARNTNVGVVHETLTIISNDDFEPNKKVFLHGLWQRQGEGIYEPTINEIIDAFGLETVTGFVSKKEPADPNFHLPTGDEVISATWVRADISKPIYARQLAAFHSCCSATERLRYNKPGSSNGSSTTNHIGLDGQSLLPRSNINGTPAEKFFIPSPTYSSPTGAFTFTIGNACSDSTLNLNGWVGIRIWRARDASGNIIPDAFLMSMDYLSNGFTNFDYNDNLFYVENIRPEFGTSYSSKLNTDLSEVRYGEVMVNNQQSVTLNLSSTGQMYPDGTFDPKIIINTIEIIGDNFEDFTASLPLDRNLDIGETTTMQVSFKPKSVGLKNAELLIYYNSASSLLNNYSPKRIPLYGIAESACIDANLVKRIKAAATSAAPVMIVGESWESDVPYRKGSIKLDNTGDTSSEIVGTDRDALYRSYLSASKDLSTIRYDIPITNGTYTVRIHFAENYFNFSNQRINNILIENQAVLQGFDLIDEVGYKTAKVKDFITEVKDGRLSISFKPIVNRPAFSGVEVYSFVPNPSIITLNLTGSGLTNSNCGQPDGSVEVLAGNTANPVSYKMGKFGDYQPSGLFAGLTKGDYVIYAKDDVTGCEVSKTFSIVENVNAVNFTLTTGQVSCNALSDGNATVSNFSGGVAPYTVVWNNNPALTTPTVIGLPLSSTHTVTVTDANGCSKTQVFEITKTPGCPLRINTGGSLYISTTGKQFLEDQFFTGGTENETLDNVAGTSDPTLYQSERIGNTFSYNIPVANGIYGIIIHFAEINPAILEGDREFNVSIEGSPVLFNYDMVGTVGSLYADLRTYNTTVSDNLLTITFTGLINTAKVSAIELIPANVPNVPPVAGVIPDQEVPINELFSFSFGVNTFTDPGDPLRYIATLSDNSPLPAWISFDADTRTFTSTGDAALGTSIDVKVTATDTYGTSASIVFNVLVVDIDVLSLVEVKQNTRIPVLGGVNRQIIGIELDAGVNAGLVATSFTLTTNGTDNLADILNAKLFYTGTSPDFDITTQFGATVANPSGNFTIGGNQVLSAGVNYFWLVYDLDINATLGNLIDAECEAIMVDGRVYNPGIVAPDGYRQISELDEIPGNLFDFQGSDDFLEVPSSIRMSNQLTLEGWINPRQNTAADKWIMGETGGARLIQNGNQIRFYIVDATGTLRGPAIVTIPAIANDLEAWYHIAATYNGTTLRIYLDGIEGTPFVYVGSNSDRNGTFRFGASSVADQNDMQFDEVRLWNVARSTNEIRENMHLTLQGNEAGLLSYWQFNELDISLEAKEIVGDNYAVRNNALLSNWVLATEPVGGGVSFRAASIANGTVVYTGTGISITFGANHPAGDLVVTRIDNLTPYETYPSALSLGRPKSDSYWVINNFGVNKTAASLTPMNIRVDVSEDIYNLGINPTDFWFHKRPSNSTGLWIEDYKSVAKGGVVGARYVDYEGITSFSQFIVSVGGGPLPIKLLSFEGERITENKVELNWETNFEENNKGFEIEKSTDGKNFSKIGFIDGKGGVLEINTYTFIDYNAFGSTYYRLKQIDLNDDFVYSPIIFVEGINLTDILLYPNPTLDFIKIRGNESLNEVNALSLRLYDIRGEEILSSKGSLNTIESAINDKLKQLSRGMYILRFFSGNKVQIVKLIKN